MAVLAQTPLVTDSRRLVRTQVGKEEELDRTCPSYSWGRVVGNRRACRGLVESGQLCPSVCVLRIKLTG